MKQFVIVTVCLAALLGVVVGFLAAPRDKNLGIPLTESFYTTPTASQASCGTATSTAVLASSTSRQSAKFSSVGNSAFALCQSEKEGCTAAKAIFMAATSTSGSGFYEQSDAYSGSYFCIGIGATGTVNVISK